MKLIIIHLIIMYFLLLFSPSGLTTRKSNEILLGGLNSLKTVATSVAKKYDDFKEAYISPIKSNGG